MLYSIATVCLSGLLKEKIPAISKAGFQGIELFENDVISHPGPISEIRLMIEDHGLKVVTYQPFRDFEGLPGKHYLKAMDRARRKLDLTLELGCDLMMVCSSVSPLVEGGVLRAAEDFFKLGELANDRGIRVAYEALAWGRQIYDYRDSWEVVRRAMHPSVGLCLDTFHIFSRDTELASIKNIPGDQIFLVQVADAPRLSMDTLSWSRHYRCFPGQGELPLKRFLDHLESTGYGGPLSLEIFNDQFRAGSIEQTARDGYRSLVYLAEKTEHQDRHKPEPARNPNQVAFLEFAIDPNDREGFFRLIKGLGFRLAGTHKSKSIEHWQQGEIHLVLNFEQGSFAEDYYNQHGSSICAIALEFDEVSPIVSRCHDLKYPCHYGDPVRDRQGNPGITGFSENLLYFVESREPSIWERDFNRLDPGDGEVKLIAIDHISLSLSYEEMLRAILLYRSIFDMKAMATADVYDPGGLIRSQVMKTDNNKTCIALNSSEAQNTIASQLYQRQSGPGVQHVALSTTDIFPVANSIINSGIGLLKMPENYYADLGCRFNLTESELDHMSKLGILYDEDEHGSFFQLYTELFAGRFCFEIVQRSGYRGFGAANAPFRSAGQFMELENAANLL